MGVDSKSWLEALTWAVANLPNLSLLLVIAAGAWVWLKDIWYHGREEGQHESFIQSILRVNAELTEENRKLRSELFSIAHRQPGGGELAAPPANSDGH